MTSFDAPARPLPKLVHTAGAVALIVAISAMAGALTPVGEQYLPHSIRTMANSSGSWTVITFVAVYLSGLRRLSAALMGAVSFVVMNLSFYAVFSLDGYYSRHYLAFWIGIAIVIGPVVGLSASWLRATTPALRAAAVAAPSAVLIGEGFYILVDMPGTATLYALASIVVGLVMFAGLAAFYLHSPALVALGIALCLLAALAFFLIYGLMPIVLDKPVP